MNVFAFTWTDRLCSQREQCAPVDTEKDVGRFLAAAWWTVRMQGTGPEYKSKYTDTPPNDYVKELTFWDLDILFLHIL